MKLALHIGTEKTGTTTFQQWANANRAALLAQGIVYPRCFGDANHRKLSILGMRLENADDAFAANGIATGADHAAFVRDLRAAFLEEVREHGPDVRWLISSEHLHSRVRTVDMVQKVGDFLREVFDDITVHVHLRPQVDVAVSLASTLTRAQGTVNRAWFNAINAQGWYYNYHDLVLRWRQVFGADRVKIIPFAREPDITRALCSRLDIDATGLPAPQRVNEALDWRLMALVNHLAAAARQGRRQFRLPPGFLDAAPVQERLQIGEELAREVQARFDASNAALCALDPTIAEADLRPDWSRYAGRPNLTVVPAASIYGGQMLDLIDAYEALLAAERARRHLAEAERAIARGNTVNARNFIQKAETQAGQLRDDSRDARPLAAIETRIDTLRAELDEAAAPPAPRSQPGGA